MKKTFCTMLYLSACLSRLGVCEIIDFESASDLVDFTVSALNPGPTLSVVSRGGVADSGALKVDAVGSNVNGTWNKNSFDFSDMGKKLQSSIFFKFHNFSLPINSSRDFITIGFLPSNTSVLPIGEGFGVKLTSRNDGSIDFYAWSGLSGMGSSTDISLTDGNWYQLAGEFENLGAAIAFSGSLNDFGPEGTQFQREVSHLSQTMIATPSTLSDNSVWPVFSASSEGGTNLIDNVAFIPEPCTLWQLMIGMVTIFLISERTFRLNVATLLHSSFAAP